jgi:hypothetical protein
MKSYRGKAFLLGMLLGMGGLGFSAEPGAPLLAHWTLDEISSEVVDVSGAGNHAHFQDPIFVQARTTPRGRFTIVEMAENSRAREREGVLARGVEFSGAHNLSLPLKLEPSSFSGIAFSVWARPSRFDAYNEIFRRENGSRRLLFSFQEGGAILSLGLNIDNYVECDAPIDPNLLLDGQWHHCAASFDGAVMRVYVDGREVGALERPGTVEAGPSATASIGSTNGRECFQGGLDDLRVYGAALTADDIRDLYQAGRKILRSREKKSRDLAERLYERADSFSKTLTMLQRHGTAMSVDPILCRLMAQALQGDFPKEATAFREYTDATLTDYLVHGWTWKSTDYGEKMLELLFEYQPQTDAQWQGLNQEERRHWKTMDALKARHQALSSSKNHTPLNPEWIDLLLEMGDHIQFRPVKQEAVAPYITPSTPEIRNHSAKEAQALLEKDWLFQADGEAKQERIALEIEWARQLAARIEGADFTAELATLQALKTASPSEALYYQVRAIKRTMMFKNPVVDFNSVLFVDMPYPGGSEWPHETRHRLGYMAVPGARLLVLDGLSPGGELRQLMPQAPLHGSFWRPDLSHDASKVLFCFKPANEKAFHLYEINMDGTGLTQLTDGIYDDLDPIYLPDGEHIIFSTTRGHTYVRCMPPTSAYVLARARRTGKDIYLLSRSNEPDYLPSVLNDGRVVYTRWEYTDKPLWRAQSLWTLRPDGTQVNTLWGNQSVWPDLLKDARSIPGSKRVMFTGSAHHNWFSGSVGIIDPSLGDNFPEGLRKVTADVQWPESGNGPVDPIESPRYHRSGDYSAYYSPYPLSEEDFIVSAKRGDKFLLYLMDVDGNRELIYEGVHHIFHALPVRPRALPQTLPDQVVWPSREERLQPQGGVIYSADVYQGAPEVLRGKAKHLRVLSIEAKTYTYWHKRPYLSTGPVVSAVQSEGVKRILGTVPIEDDGSLCFEAPTGIPLHFQLLDENYRALQTMRSFTGVMPGESRGCTGCHARHSAAPAQKPNATALYERAPRAIEPPPWGEDSISYDRYVRPALDQYCGDCHQGDGEAREVLDFTPKEGRLGFDESYWLLTGQPAWGTPYTKPENPPPGFGIADMLMVEGYDQRDPAAYETPAPMTKLSYASELIRIASSGEHYEVKVDPITLRKLILWVDAMCPYRGSDEVRAIPDPEFQGIDWLAVRPTIKTAPTIIRPGPVDES